MLQRPKPRACALHREKPLQWEAQALQQRADPARRNERKPAHSDEDPAHQKNKSINLKRKGTEPVRTRPSGLLLQQLGTRPCPERAVTLTKQRGSPTAQLAPALAPPSLPPPSPRGGLPGQPEEEHGWCHQIQPSCQWWWAYEICIGTFPPKSTPSRPLFT